VRSPLRSQAGARLVSQSPGALAYFRAAAVMDEVYALIQPKSHNTNYWGGIAAGNNSPARAVRSPCRPQHFRAPCCRNQMEALELASWWPQMEKGRQSVMSTFEPRFGGAHSMWEL
jgi:hypothetical protein